MKLAGKSEIEIGGERERKREGYEPQEPTQRERSTLEEDRDGEKKREKRTENPHPRQGLVRNLLVLSVRTEHPWKLAVRFRLGLFVTHSLRSSSSSPLSSSFPPFLPFFFFPPPSLLSHSSFLFPPVVIIVVLFIPPIVAAYFIAASVASYAHVSSTRA